MLKGAGTPVIEIWDQPSRAIGHSVGFSNRRAARDMAEHLIARGYRRIVFVGETADAGTRGARRRQGFADAIAAAGLGEPRIVGLAPPPVTMSQARAGLSGILARWPDTDALMCVSDPCAFGMLMEAQAIGLQVPDRLGIAGFGDFEVGRCSRPSLTTVAVNAATIGCEAGRLVVELTSDRASRSRSRRLETPVRIEPRESTR